MSASVQRIEHDICVFLQAFQPFLTSNILVHLHTLKAFSGNHVPCTNNDVASCDSQDCAIGFLGGPKACVHKFVART